MRLLHLTDLHYVAGNPFQVALTKALIEDLKKQSATEPFDLAIFSGDLVNNPDDADVYEHFERNFLNPVLEAAGLTVADLVLCPGNHDVSEAAVKAWPDERKKIVESLRDQNALAKHLATPPAQAYIKGISQGFFALAERTGTIWTNPLVHVYDFPAKGIAFVALNSAYGCGLEGSEHDRGKLALSGEAVLKAFQAVPTGRNVYSLVHHTPSDFNEACARIVKPMITKDAVIHFFGHVHDPKPIVEHSPDSSCFLLQGGALYEKAGHYNGYVITDIGPNQEVRASYRTYWPARSEFDVGTNVGTGGVFYSSNAAESFWHRAASVPDNDDVCLWLMDTRSAVAAEIDTTLVSRKLTDTFVDPVISLVGAEGGITGQHLTTANIINSNDNLVIAADSEYGATSLLNYLTLQFHDECLNLPTAVVPSLVDARLIKDYYPAKVTAALRSGLPDSNEPQLKLQPLHDCGRLVVLLDNVDIANSTHLEFIRAARAQYPKARMIVAVKMPFINFKRLRPVVGINDFVFAQIDALIRGKVRSLVEKWKLPSRYNTDAVTEEIDARFRALGIPMTAAYVVIYLSILEDSNEGFNPINSSVVIEQFVEGALQKYKQAYIFRATFDYKNQIDYLGHIAERMCRKNEFSIKFEELYAWTKDYFENLGLEHDIKKLIEHFVAVKVFADEGNSIYFRYNIFLSFFIAHQMMRSSDFKEWIKEGNRFMNYVTEIDIYCGLSRQDVALLDFFGDEFAKYSVQLEDLVKPLSWTDRLEKLSIPASKKEDVNQFTDRIVEQLTSDMPAEQRDAEMSERTGQPPSVTPVAKRPEVLGLLPNWVMALRAYTVCLKNLENIHKDKKAEHMTKVLSGWSTLLLYGCIVFKEVVDKKELAIGPMRFKLELPEGFDARVLRLIFLSIPVYISDLLRKDLGSQKLSVQLRNDELAKSLSDAFLQTGLYADLKLNEFTSRLKHLKDRAAEAKAYVISEALLIKMRDIFLRLGLTDTEQAAMVQIAAELSADIKGLSGDERLREIEKYSLDLKKHEQVKRLRDRSG